MPSSNTPLLNLSLLIDVTFSTPTDYYKRGITLAHDARRERELKLWQEWSAAEGWKSETFEQFRQRVEGKRPKLSDNF